MTIDHSHLDNEQLIELVDRASDFDAFQQLYERYSGMVMGLSFKIVGQRTLAEEITQETFWRVWRNADSYNRSRGTFTNWMFGIARNLSIDTLRRNKRITFQSIYDETSRHEVDEILNHNGHTDIAELAWSAVENERLHSALTQLPPEQRNVIIWVYFQGKTRREIAAEQGIPFGTINTRARLALKKLHHFLSVERVEA